MGKQLDRLWSAFEGAEGVRAACDVGAGADVDRMQSSDSLLKEFLEVFASRYDWRCLSHWEHGPLQELEHDVEHEFYEHVVHPTLVIMGLKTELQQFGARLHQGRCMFDASLLAPEPRPDRVTNGLREENTTLSCGCTVERA